MIPSTKYRFESRDENSKVTIETEHGTWMDLCDRFLSFLQGSGYVLDGTDLADYYEEQWGWKRKEHGE